VHTAPPKASWPVSLVLVACASVFLPGFCVFFGTFFGRETLRLGSFGAAKSSGSGYSYGGCGALQPSTSGVAPESGVALRESSGAGLGEASPAHATSISLS
jgi:hypothetical protein